MVRSRITPELFTRTSSPPRALILDLLYYRFDLLRHVALDYQRFIQFLRYTDIGNFVFGLKRRRHNSPRIALRGRRKL